MRMHSVMRTAADASRNQRHFADSFAILAAAEYDLPGEWEEPDFDDDSEDDVDDIFPGAPSGRYVAAIQRSIGRNA